MAVAVDRERAQAFERDGFLSGVRVCTDAKADEIRRQFDALEAVEGRERCQIGLLDRHVDQRFVWELAIHPAIVACVSAVLGPDVMLLATHFFCKYPEPGDVPGSRPADPRRRRRRGATDEQGGTSGCDRAAKFVAWHQDVTYWGLEPPLAVTAWYAVDDSDVENGCMRVIPGTHRAGVRQHGTSERAGNLLSINQEVLVTPDEEVGAVDLVLRAGAISLHHGMLIHGSNPNRSTRRRCGLTLRYVPPFVRHVEENSLRRPWSAILVHGEDRYHHFGDRPASFR